MKYLKKWVREFMLLLASKTYIPLPRRAYAEREALPRAMRFMPLLGLLSGAIIYGAMRLTVVMPMTGSAAVLICLHLLTGGAFFLYDLMNVADGSFDKDREDDGQWRHMHRSDSDTEVKLKQRLYRVGRRGMTGGLIYLLALYALYLLLIRQQQPGQIAVLIAPVIACCIMCWLIWAFPAAPPARFHRAMQKRDFYISCLLSLLAILPFSCFELYFSLLIAFLGGYIFATYRIRAYGRLEEECYGAVAAWSHILFLLVWIVFDVYF